MGFIHRHLYFRIIRRNTGTSSFSGDARVDVVSSAEWKELNRNTRRSVMRSAALGGIMVLFLVIPQWLLSDFFSKGLVTWNFFDFELNLNLYTMGWSLFLIVLELVLLQFLHLAAIRNVALNTGYASWNALRTDDGIAERISAIAMQQKPEDIRSMGFDPYIGMSKVRLYLIGVLSLIKAVVSNLIVRVILLRVMGRFAVREVLDLAGVPVYAFWNGFTTWRLLRSARIAFMGEYVLRDWLRRWENTSFNQQEVQLFHDATQQVFMMRRSYHPNLVTLGKQINTAWRRNDPINSSTGAFVIRCNECSDQARRVIQDILILGITLGEVRGYRSSRVYKEIVQSEYLRIETDVIVRMRKRLRKGEPLFE